MSETLKKPEGLPVESEKSPEGLLTESKSPKELFDENISRITEEISGKVDYTLARAVRGLGRTIKDAHYLSYNHYDDIHLLLENKDPATAPLIVELMKKFTLENSDYKQATEFLLATKCYEIIPVLVQTAKKQIGENLLILERPYSLPSHIISALKSINDPRAKNALLEIEKHISSVKAKKAKAKDKSLGALKKSLFDKGNKHPNKK